MEHKTILIVDDEVDYVNSARSQLQKRGYNVITAYNGLEALEKVKEGSPDLVVLDINMPKMGGIEFFKNICNNEGNPECHVLITTVRTDLEEIFDDLGVTGFLPKPFSITDLVKNIEDIFTRS